LMGATSNGIQDITLGQLPQERFELGNTAVSTDFAKNVPDGGITFGIIKDQVAVFLRALEQVTDTTVLANPKILALNKQKGQVIVGRRDGFLTTTVTETQAVQTVEFLETGTQLLFRPFIGDDGFVRVELHPEDSVGFVNAQGLPSEQTTEVTTNVIVRDGQTILIGGLFRELTTDARSQVPGLGSIPGLGQLFRSNNDSSGREEVIILLTLHIVKDQDAFAAASRDQYENIERLRVGIRRGLMWHGRDRLAQAHYQRALEAINVDKRDKALWHTQMALHAEPRLLPAVELKEKILGERDSYEDGTSSRSFLYRLIAQEKGYPLSPFGRPAPGAIP
jgi:type IV pilus assembly protein PilQ